MSSFRSLVLKESNDTKILIFSAVKNLNVFISTIGILPCQSSECILGGPKKGSKGREGKFVFIEHLLSLR